MLATGDSMIQIIDGFLTRGWPAPASRVRSDAHIATGISKPRCSTGRACAAPGAARRPDVSRDVPRRQRRLPDPRPGRRAAAARAWIAEYARRARRMMHAYAPRRAARGCTGCCCPHARGGFFTRDLPRREQGAPARGAAAAARRAADRARSRSSRPAAATGSRCARRGAVVRVRQGDGVHLSSAGASIAANVIVGRCATSASWTGRAPPRWPHAQSLRQRARPRRAAAASRAACAAAAPARAAPPRPR